MRFFLCCLCAIACCRASAGAFSLPDLQDRYAPRCVREILNCQYTSAISIADSAAAADTLDPLAPVLRLAAVGIRDVDFDTLLDTAAFLSTFHAAGARIGKYEARAGASSYSTMLRGFCKGIYASFHLRRGSYYAALHSGFSALSLLEKSVVLDSSNVEPLFLLGLYDFAKSELKKRLWWVLFWYPGSKERGIRRLQACAAGGILTGTGALFGLAEIYTRENKPDLSDSIIGRLMADCPGSRFTLWAREKQYESKRLFYEASLVCERLSESYATSPEGAYNAFLLRTMQVQLLIRSGQKKDAIALCKELLRKPPDGRTGSLYNDTEKMLRRLNDGDD